jgi:hypothetical protein
LRKIVLAAAALLCIIPSIALAGPKLIVKKMGRLSHRGGNCRTIRPTAAGKLRVEESEMLADSIAAAATKIGPRHVPLAALR